jgi:hypothetical protein
MLNRSPRAPLDTEKVLMDPYQQSPRKRNTERSCSYHHRSSVASARKNASKPNLENVSLLPQFRVPTRSRRSIAKATRYRPRPTRSGSTGPAKPPRSARSRRSAMRSSTRSPRSASAASKCGHPGARLARNQGRAEIACAAISKPAGGGGREGLAHTRAERQPPRR